MKQNIFEIRQRTEDLMVQAMEIWRTSDKSEQLEGLQNDPIFRLLLTAIAYQANEQDAELEQLKTDIMQELENQMTFDDAGKALPATAVVKTAPIKSVGSLDVGSHLVFSIGSDTKYLFEPLLSTRVYNINVGKVAQLDGRRWLVSLDFGKYPVRNLKGFAFVIANPMFHGLSVSMADNGMELPLIAPWDYANLPMSDHFSFDNMIYNRSCGYSGLGGLDSFTDYCALDVFAQQNVRYYVVDDMADFEETLKIDLLFEFEGLSHGFVFNSDTFHINTIILANVGSASATLSRSMPIARLTGMTADKSRQRQFVHMLRPAADQMYADGKVMVRRIGADRFNRGRLVKLLFNLYTKFTSDLYAFQNISTKDTNTIMSNIRKNIIDLLRVETKEGTVPAEGVYAVLRNKDRVETSMEVNYLVTSGAAVNTLLKRTTKFDTPQELDAAQTEQICNPTEGMDEIHDPQTLKQMKRYALATGGRIVTQTDIKLFCQTELAARYGVVNDLIRLIRIERRHVNIGTFHTYEIVVKIEITSNIYTQQAFAAKEVAVETYLQRMIEVRMSGIYPVKVELELV